MCGLGVCGCCVGGLGEVAQCMCGSLCAMCLLGNVQVPCGYVYVACMHAWRLCVAVV